MRMTTRTGLQVSRFLTITIIITGLLLVASAVNSDEARLFSAFTEQFANWVPVIIVAVVSEAVFG